MMRLVVALSAMVLAAMLLWPAEAAAYDRSRDHTADASFAVCALGLRVECAFTIGWQPASLHVDVAIDRVEPREKAVRVRDQRAGGSEVLWKAAGIVRRVVLDRLGDLILPRRAH